MPLGQNNSDYGKSNYGSQGNQGKASNTSTAGKFWFIYYPYRFSYLQLWIEDILCSDSEIYFCLVGFRFNLSFRKNLYNFDFEFYNDAII